MTLREAQDIVQQHAPTPYYREKYRALEDEYLSLVVEILGGLNPKHLVDVGPGWGTLAVWAWGNGALVDVVDFVDRGTFLTKELCERAHLHYHQVFLETDRHLPPLLGDVVTMTMVIGHLRYRPDNAIGRAARLLPNAATFVCCNVDKARCPEMVPAYVSWKDMPVPGEDVFPSDKLVTCTFDEGEYRELLGSCFDEVEVKAAPDVPILTGVCRVPRCVYP